MGVKILIIQNGGKKLVLVKKRGQKEWARLKKGIQDRRPYLHVLWSLQGVPLPPRDDAYIYVHACIYLF